MNVQTLKSEFLLLLAAMIWGFAFVAQRVGMEHVGPYIFNAIRFGLGALTLIPVLLYRRRYSANPASQHLSYAGAIVGVVLFLGISLQQVGIVYTPAGKSGFITGLYVVLVPVLGLFLGQKARLSLILGVFLALAGMYFLCISDKMSLSKGDTILLLSTLVWAIHVQVIDYFSNKTIAERLAFEQFVVCSLLSFLVSLAREKTTWEQLSHVVIPLLYGGILSSGIAYTLQVVGQKHVAPAPAAILMSMESVFAAIGGYFFLRETLTFRSLFGCALILAGMLTAQLCATKNIQN